MYMSVLGLVWTLEIHSTINGLRVAFPYWIVLQFS